MLGIWMSALRASIQCRKCRLIVHQVGYGAPHGQLYVAASLAVYLGKLVEPRLHLALRISVSTTPLQLYHPLEVVSELLWVSHKSGHELPDAPLNLFGAVVGANAVRSASVFAEAE